PSGVERGQGGCDRRRHWSGGRRRDLCHRQAPGDGATASDSGGTRETRLRAHVGGAKETNESAQDALHRGRYGEERADRRGSEGERDDLGYTIAGGRRQ